MKEALSKNRVKSTRLRRGKRDLKETIKPTYDKVNSPPKTISKEKGKHVSFAKNAKKISMELNGPSVKVYKSKFRFVQQMKKVAQAPEKYPFNELKGYQRCSQELK